MLKEEQKKAIKQLLATIAEAIYDARQNTLGGIPNGELYVILMGKGISFELYTQLIDALKTGGFIKEWNHVLQHVKPLPYTFESVR